MPQLAIITKINYKAVDLVMAKAKKTRGEKYNTKLAINGTFDAVIKASVIAILYNR